MEANDIVTYQISEKDYNLLQKIKAQRARQYAYIKKKRKNDPEFRKRKMIQEEKSRQKKQNKQV